MSDYWGGLLTEADSVPSELATLLIVSRSVL